MKLTPPTDALLERLGERAAPEPTPATQEQAPRDAKTCVKKQQNKERVLHRV